MTRLDAQEQDGVFFVDQPQIGPGDDYGYSADGGPVRPDPRSFHQPHGVHGLSRVVDLDAHAWQDQAFAPVPWSDAIVYELHVGTFSPEGTFSGAVAHLDHLVELGITHVEVMPLAAFAGRTGWGYDGVALFAVHQPYGGPQAFQAFVDACHQRGLAVILDVVYNHLGPSGNYLATWAPYFAEDHRTPWGDAPNFDQAHSDEVRRFVIDNALHWLRSFHVDGLRLDAVQAFSDRSPLHILEELAQAVQSCGAQLGRAHPWVVIAECDANDPRIVRSSVQGGQDLTSMWCDDLHHALHAVTTGERVGYYADFGRTADVAKALRQGMVLDGQPSRYRQRRHGRNLGPLGGEQLVVYLQNHDQIGNRPQGERLTSQISAARVRVAAALLLLSRYVPLLFQGEEWASQSRFPFFTDHQEPELNAAIRAGRAQEQIDFGWATTGVPPDAPEAFAVSRLDWENRAKPGLHADMLAWYRALIQLRREFLRGSRPDEEPVEFDEEARWLALNSGPLRIVAHLGDGCVPWPAEQAAQLHGRTLLLGEAPVREEELPPWSVSVWSPVTL
jgi:maltooligosyltrehalose trehalohydrolase